MFLPIIEAVVQRAPDGPFGFLAFTRASTNQRSAACGPATFPEAGGRPGFLRTVPFIAGSSMKAFLVTLVVPRVIGVRRPLQARDGPQIRVDSQRIGVRHA